MARAFKTPISVEGGQIELATAPSGTLSGTNVTIDVYGDKLRFFESGGTNRGAYIPLTSTGASVGTSLLGGTTGAMNASYTYATKQSNVSSAGTVLASVSLTTNGYPVQVLATGDMENNSAGGWVTLQLYRGSTAIGNIVHAESSAGSENVPFALTAIDVPSAGTYTYSLKINTSAGGTFNFGESNGPVITVIELSGPKGDTGAAGTSPNAFTTVSTPSGTAPVADNTADTLTLTTDSYLTITGDATGDSIAFATGATSANTASKIVARDASGNFSAGAITATSFVKSAGTSTQFLKADGTVDSSTYLTTAVTSIAGTTNQITASASTGSVTLSLPSAVTISGASTAGSFVKSSNNAAQFLKADGNVAGDYFTWYIPSSTQSITASSETAVNIWTSQYNSDSTNAFAVSTAGQAIQVKRAGRYNISALLSWAANATGYRILRLYINNTLYYGTLTAPGASVAFQSNLAVTEVPLAANDVLELRVFQTSGGALNIGGATYISRWSMTYLGAS